CAPSSCAKACNRAAALRASSPRSGTRCGARAARVQLGLLDCHAALSLCLRMGFIRKPLRSFRTDSLEIFSRLEFSWSLRHIAAMGAVMPAKFSLGQVVRHGIFPFRGGILDVDPEFNNTEEWYQAIPAEVRPRKDQPFYHLLAENSDSQYIAYV